MARAGLTAERLVRAAAELADEVGFENVTVSAARRFGVKDASLYSHVKNAQELRAGVAALALTELADRAAEALAGRSGKEALRAYADAYRTYAKQHPGRYAASWLMLEAETAVVGVNRRHSELTRALLRGYALREPDETDAIRMLHATLHGFVRVEAAGGFEHHSRSVAKSWARAVDALDVALRNWPDEEPTKKTR
ncbi:TetR/AcrR family transcriptional regulator [Catenulispora yoronensis]